MSFSLKIIHNNIDESVQKPWLRPSESFFPPPIILPDSDTLDFIFTQFQSVVQVLHFNDC